MRDLGLWGVATAFLLAALFTVHVRRELYDLGREIGLLECAVRECGCRNDNLELEILRLRSPRDLFRRAEDAGVEFAWERAAER